MKTDKLQQSIIYYKYKFLLQDKKNFTNFNANRKFDKDVHLKVYEDVKSQNRLNFKSFFSFQIDSKTDF